MRHSNIRPFRPRQDDAPMLFRLLSAVTYIGIWLLLSQYGQMAFTILILLAIVNFMFYRGVLKAPRFFRFHFLQATLLFLFLFYGMRLLITAVQFLVSAFALLQLGDLANWLGNDLLVTLAMGSHLVLMIAGLSQAIVALFGKTPRLGFITANVTYWV